MSTINMLKITTDNDNIVLLSSNATQSITPISEHKIIRNINNKPINQITNTLFKCTIKTPDNPNIDLLLLGKEYKIYSINEFKSTNNITFEHIPVTKNNFEYIYKPIFKTILVDFEYLQNSDNAVRQWVLQFIQS